MTKIFHPLLALIASGTDRELAKYVQFLKEENKILRSRISGEIHTKPEERQRLLQFGKALGRAIEELITIVSASTFYRWSFGSVDRQPLSPTAIDTGRLAHLTGSQVSDFGPWSQTDERLASAGEMASIVQTWPRLWAAVTNNPVAVSPET